MRTMYVVVVLVIFMISSIFSADQPVVSGFGQVKIDSAGFSIPKVRVIADGLAEVGIKEVKVSYIVYADFASDGKPELGFAQINFQFKQEWLPKLIVGRTLDPISYQFPGPAVLGTHFCRFVNC